MESRYADGLFEEVFDENTTWQLSTKLGSVRGSSSGCRAGRNGAAAGAGGFAGTEKVGAKRSRDREKSVEGDRVPVVGHEGDDDQHVDGKRNRERKYHTPHDAVVL